MRALLRVWSATIGAVAGEEAGRWPPAGVASGPAGPVADGGALAPSTVSIATPTAAASGRTRTGGRATVGARTAGLAFLLSACVLAVGLCASLLRFAIWGGQDASYYPPRYVEFYRLLSEGDLFPRWAPDFSYGYGEPFFNFNPPLVYYLNALFHHFGASFAAAEAWEALALALIAALGMYKLTATFAGPRGGLLAAAAYVFAPYTLVLLYVRHSMPDYAAFAVLPLSYWGLYQYAAAQRGRFLVVGAVGTALLVLSSNPIALITLPVWGACLLIAAWAQRRRAILFRGVWCLGLGLGLSACFWLPAFAEHQLVHTERLITPGYLYYRNHFVYLWQYAASPWGYGDSVAGPGDGMSFSIGIMHLLLASAGAGAGIVLLWRRRAGRRTLVFPLAVGLLTVLGGAAMGLDLSRPLWDHVQTLQYLQFPWRFLSLISFGAALLIGMLFALATRLTGWRGWGATAVMLVLIAAVLADSWGHARPDPNWQPPADVLNLSPERIVETGVKVDLEREFEPHQVAVSPRAPPATRVTAANGADVRIDNQTADRLDLRVAAQAPTRLRINIHYFAGWTVVEHGRPLPLTITAPDDLMEVQLGAGTHDLTVAFEDTPDRRAANDVSILSVVLLLASVLWPRLPIARRGASS